MPQKGEKAPPFSLPSTRGEFQLEETLKEGRLILVFYTEDNTPTCNQELISFKEEYRTLRELGAQVVAISADSLESHRELERRLGGLPFSLAADINLEVAQLYGVADDAGRRSHRAVFVVDTDGTIAHHIPWYQPGNASQFLEVFTALGLEQE